jgi:DHA1 family tetracycline resistance protein-like MFS transporter
MVKKITSAKFLIFFIVFINLLGYGILYPILPLYEKVFNTSPFLITAAVGAYPIAQFFAMPLLGFLSDRYGRRPVLLYSLLGSVVGFLFFAFANNIYILFIGRIIDGFSGGNVSTAQAYMADITPKEKRTEGMGIISGAISLGFVAGPIIGGLLGQYGVRVPSLFAALLALANFILTFLFLKETEKEETRISAHKLVPLKEIVRALREKRIGLALVLVMAISMAFSLHLPIFSFFTEKVFMMGAFGSGILLSYRAVISAVVQLFLVGPVTEKLGEIRLLKIVIPVMIAGLMIAGIFPHLALFILGSTLIELGGDFIGPVAMGMVSKWAKPSEQGEMMGIAASMGSLGRIVGPYLGGASFQLWGTGMPFYLGAAFMLAGFLTLFAL